MAKHLIANLANGPDSRLCLLLVQGLPIDLTYYHCMLPCQQGRQCPIPVVKVEHQSMTVDGTSIF